MSTNKTPNYQLHSWLPDDEFHVSEINENFTKLDATLGSKAKIIIGYYTGNDTGNRPFSLGFQPLAVHIEEFRGIRDLNITYGGLFAALEGQGYVALTEDGFTILQPNYLNSMSCKYIYVAFITE